MTFSEDDETGHDGPHRSQFSSPMMWLEFSSVLIEHHELPLWKGKIPLGKGTQVFLKTPSKRKGKIHWFPFTVKHSLVDWDEFAEK